MNHTKSILLLLLVFAYQGTINAQSAQNFKLLYKWEDSSLKGSWLYDNTYNEIWGVENNGREYAVIGSTFGTHFIDVTDSSSFKEVDRVKGGANGPWVVHRDYKDYKGYLYAVCDEGNNSALQIIDYSTLPDSVHVAYDTNEFIIKSHNIYIDTASARLYAAGGYGLKIFSLENPIKPKLIGEYTGDGVHDLYVRDDTGYLNCGTSLRIIDFTDPVNEVQLFVLNDYPEKGYNHNGWLNASGDTYLFTDETKGTRIKVCSVSDLSNFEIVSMIQPIYSDSSIAHNVVIKEDIAYISYYNDGTQVFDISNPKAPERIGYYNSGNYDTFAPYMGVWGVYPFLPSGKILVSNMQKGLLVLESTPGYVLGREKIPAIAVGIEVYPNPIQEELNVSISLKQNEQVLMEVFDIQGKKLRTLMDSPMVKGENALKFNLGKELYPDSIYLLHITIAGRTEVNKIVR
jgi:choice-of-anchor B domain-containing protein